MSAPVARPLRNPWPRFALAAVLTVWGGSNLWSAISSWQQLAAGPDDHNRTVTLALTALFALLPLVIAVALVWTLMNHLEPGEPESRLKPGRQGTSPGKKSSAQRKSGKGR